MDIRWFRRGGQWARVPIEFPDTKPPIDDASIDVRTRVVRNGDKKGARTVQQEYWVRNFFLEEMRVLTKNEIPEDVAAEYIDHTKQWFPVFELDKAEGEFSERHSAPRAIVGDTNALQCIDVEVMTYFRVPGGEVGVGELKLYA